MKKRFMLAIAIWVSVSVAYAADSKWTETCKAVSEIAEKVMDGRQKGVAFSRMIDIDKANTLWQEMVISAYDSPRYQTPEIQIRAAQEFRDEWYGRCIKIKQGR